MRAGTRVKDLSGEWDYDRYGLISEVLEDWFEVAENAYLVAWEDNEAHDVLWFRDDLEIVKETSDA